MGILYYYPKIHQFSMSIRYHHTGIIPVFTHTHPHESQQREKVTFTKYE